MEIKLTKFENMTAEKAAYIEEQANRLFDFVMKSREELNREAHTTINWLFVIIVGSAGYIASLVGWELNVKWWLLVPLFVGILVCVYAAIRLFHRGLRTVSVIPAGNDPKNLMTDELMAYDMMWVRAAETSQLQERIDAARDYNTIVGDAINHARWCIVLLPILELLIALCVRSIISA